MKKIILVALTILGTCTSSFGQREPDELMQKIKGKKNLEAIMREVEQYYKKEEEEKERKFGKNRHQEGEEFESGILHWKRWEYFNQTRLKPNGDLENIGAKTEAAWRKVTEKYEGANRIESGSDAAWTFLGPNTMSYQGGFFRGISRTDRIIFHPTDGATLYVCANNGGLWRTVDGGSSWSTLTFNFPMQSISGVAINPSNTNHMYVLTGDAKWGNGVGQNSCGLWVTYDGGGYWYKTNFPENGTSNNLAGYKLVMMPGTPSTLFACTRDGLYRSTNSGNTWTGMITGGPVYDIEFDPSNSSRVYASSNGTFWLSTDAGATFPMAQRSVIAGATRIEIGVSPANNNYVYLLCGPYGGGVGTNTFSGLYRSITKGAAGSFTLRASTPNVLCDATNGMVTANDAGDQSGYDLAIDVHKSDAERIIVGGKIVWTSTNGGTTLTNLTPYHEGGTPSNPPANYIHPDIQDIAYNPLNHMLYACTDGGVYSSSNNGTAWTNITANLHTATFYHMSGATFDVNRIIGGTQDNGVKLKNDAGDFKHIAGADGFDCSFGPSISSHIYTTINTFVSKFDMNGLAATVTTPDNTSFFPTICVDPANNNVVYLAAGAAGVMKSTNGGSTWTQILNNTAKQSIVACPSANLRVYVAGLSNVFRTDNGGTNWSGNLAANPGFGTPGLITDVNVCPANSDFVYVTIGGYTAGNKVFFSGNAGASWSNISFTLPAEVKVNCVVVDQSNNAYIGTDMGVYYCSATSSDWTPFYNGLPRVPITGLSINQGASRITCATYGHGMWFTSLFTACDANFTLGGFIGGDKFYQASNQITSTATIFGGHTTNVITRAGNLVVLSPGFTIPESNKFRAYIGACETGPVPTTRGADKTPAFVTLTDPGDQTTLYRWGYITLDAPAKERFNIKIHTVQAGNFLLLITDKDETKESFRISEKAEAGISITKQWETVLIPAGKYYAQLYYNGKLAHVQELFVQ